MSGDSVESDQSNARRFVRFADKVRRLESGQFNVYDCLIGAVLDNTNAQDDDLIVCMGRCRQWLEPVVSRIQRETASRCAEIVERRGHSLADARDYAAGGAFDAAGDIRREFGLTEDAE